VLRVVVTQKCGNGEGDGGEGAVVRVWRWVGCGNGEGVAVQRVWRWECGGGSVAVVGCCTCANSSRFCLMFFSAILSNSREFACKLGVSSLWPDPSQYSGRTQVAIRSANISMRLQVVRLRLGLVLQKLGRKVVPIRLHARVVIADQSLLPHFSPVKNGMHDR